MPDESAAGEGADAEVPDAVVEWIRSVADERGVSETELLGDLLADGAPAGAGVDEEDLQRLEQRFRGLIEDVRERVIQVKREADGKAPAEHTHPELRNSVEQLGGEVRGLGDELDELEDRLDAGFENYEEILTYLTDTSDDLNRKLGQLAAALIDLRDQVGEAARAEGRRVALARLTTAANQQGVETAKCEECGGSVDISLLTDPQCPHCQATFSDLEAKRGFFRSSVLQTGTVPALEAARESTAAETDLGAIVDSAEEAPDDVRTGVAEASPADEPEAEVDPAPDRPAAAAADGAGDGTDGEEADEGGTEPDEGGSEPDEPEAELAGEGGEPDHGAPSGPGDVAGASAADAKTDGTGDLQSIEGISPEYADRLRSVGIVSLPALAMADPEELGDAIDVHAWTVADWVEAAEARSELS